MTGHEGDAEMELLERREWWLFYGRVWMVIMGERKQRYFLERGSWSFFFFVLEKIDERGYGCDWMEDNMGRERVREWRDERVQLGDKERDREEERMRGRERERGRHRVRGVLF